MSATAEGSATPGGGATDRLVRWSHVQWLAVPRRLMLRYPAARGLAGDGHVVVTLPAAAAVLPGLVLLLGLVTGLARIGYDAVYTESVVLLALMLLIGFFSSQLGVLVVVGFCIGDFLTAERYDGVSWSGSFWFSGVLGEGPLATLAHGWLPRLITYLLLAAGVVLLPRAARAVVASVGRSRQMPPLAAWGLVSALLVVIAWLGTDAWVAAAPTLIRPLFTWASPNGAPTVEAVATLQETGGVVVAAAVVATVLRQLWLGAAMVPGVVRDRLQAAESGELGATPAERAAAAQAEHDGVEAAVERLAAQVRSAATPGTTRRVSAAIVMSLLATLTLAGILERLWLWFAAFGVLLAVRVLRTTPRRLPWLERWRRIAAVLPAWARLIGLWLLSRVVVEGVSNDVIGSYTALGVFVLVSIVVVFAFFPGEPRPADDDEAAVGDDGGTGPGPGGGSAGPPPGGGPGTDHGPTASDGSGGRPGVARRVAELCASLTPPARRRLRWVQGAVAVWSATALVGLFTAAPAAADNCSVFTDCFGVANSAVEAAFGLALLAALSMVLDFIPVVGTIKGVIEAVTGRDLLTGQELAWWERALGVLPILAGLGALGALARWGRRAPTPHAPRTPELPHAPRTPDGPPGPRTPDAPPRNPDAPPRDWPENPAPGTREHDLGYDPAVGKFRPSEYQTATRIMDQQGIELTRAPKGSSADWVDADGNTYDAVGNFPAEHFDRQWDNFSRQIERHLDKADFVPVDVSTFSPEQIARVREFIEPLGPRVFIVGG